VCLAREPSPLAREWAWLARESHLLDAE